ncbi:MAG TPA: cytochrome c biogenesis protein CcsA [Planctomycetota bacterium]|nr:cytochrome c biogenesis protein CcsA [Planctomycetota bacterium]
MKSWITSLLLVAVASAAAPAQHDHSVDSPATATAVEPPAHLPQWSKEALALAATLPLQESGRVKPLGTYADFKLLEVNGRRTLRWSVERDGKVEKFERTSMEWLLDSLFFPELAETYPAFLLDTWEVADAIGVPRGKHEKRDRWSFAELAPGGRTLLAKADELEHDKQKGDAKNRDVVEEQIVQLARKMSTYQQISFYAEILRIDYPLGDDPDVRALFGGAEKASFAQILAAVPRVPAGQKGVLDGLLAKVRQAAKFSTALDLFPSPESPDLRVSRATQWLSLRDVVEGCLAGDARLGPQKAALAALDRAWHAREDGAAFLAALTDWKKAVVDVAGPTGEYKKIESEVAFYRADLFYYALILYVLGFVAVAIGWMVRAGHPLQRWLPALLAAPLALHVTGIAWRCYLRARPPVSTLYETILFISAIAVTAALVLEVLNRRRIAIAFAALIGASGLFLAMSFEAKEAYDSGADTMPQLEAVLNTNFWLSTHVTTVTIGYSAGLLAALLAHVYVIGQLVLQLLGKAHLHTDLVRNVVRMVYGVLCFGLLFSVVGTILGGVWANDSWGRFWGWDPKENGALMICLWELATLHGRMGGYLRELGLCTAAIFNGVIVAFSWWHVNLLGVGLHAYGFTHGILGRLSVFYGIEALVLMAALYLWLDRHAEKEAARKARQAVAAGGEAR